MRFLIIDDDPEYRNLLSYHVEVEWPGAAIEEYQPSSGGLLPDGFALGNYDLILLGHPLRDERGFECLRALHRRGQCPPIVVFAEPSDEFLAVDALKAGASSFFPKSRVKHRRLIETIRRELGTGHREAGGAIVPGPTPVSAPRTYKFRETLHSSDLVSVYLAEADDDGERIALKVIRYVPDDGGEHSFDRFLQEYEVIAGIAHPNVVRIFDLGIADDHAYIAMEYLPAGSLADRCSRDLTADRVLAYMRQIGGALRAIHEASVLHRDLKPANIMFREDDTLALIDFGLAKQMKLRAAITGAGQIFGTPYYMSPEQGHAEPADERSDIYSLGCIFHELITGERPFVASSAMGVIYKHSKAPRPKLSGANERFQPVLDRMLAVRPKDRYQSAAELLDGLAAL